MNKEKKEKIYRFLCKLKDLKQTVKMAAVPDDFVLMKKSPKNPCLRCGFGCYEFTKKVKKT